ncbi:MAG: substrate-binding domain-containing protein [Oscillospiraceae bacterium]|nr:substrate-binding domain-containing protein [Oscillospiraceae bacterium]
MSENADVKVTYNPTGSGAGIQAVREGRCDIGLSSRNLKDKEAANLKAEVVAIDGIAVIVNTSNTVTDLTVDEIAQIYTGEITNWNELGGADSQIVRIGCEAASGTRDGFESSA